jgi:hypothetical protein
MFLFLHSKMNFRGTRVGLGMKVSPLSNTAIIFLSRLTFDKLLVKPEQLKILFEKSTFGLYIFVLDEAMFSLKQR